MLPTKFNTLLTCCYYFRKPPKIQNIIRPTSTPRQKLPRCWTKNGELSFVFSVQGTGGSSTGPDLEMGWVIETLEAQVGQFLLGCKCPLSRGIVVQE
jgi:hypothetical protein